MNLTEFIESIVFSENGVEEHEAFSAIVQNATFKQDFGDFKGGEEHDCICFSLEEMSLISYDNEDGSIIKETPLTIVPAPVS